MLDLLEKLQRWLWEVSIWQERAQSTVLSSEF